VIVDQETTLRLAGVAAVAVFAISGLYVHRRSAVFWRSFTFSCVIIVVSYCVINFFL
jgi:hypothetical protein